LGYIMSSVSIAGDTSGSIILAAPAIAGSSTLTLPTTGGTVRTTTTPGTILQVAQGILTSTQAITGTSTWTDVTSLSVTITPTSSTSKFLLMLSVTAQGDNNAYFRLLRNGTPVGVGNAAGSTSQVTMGNFFYGSFNSSQMWTMSNQYLDSPATASAITYKAQGYANSSGGSGSVYINYSNHEDNGPWSGRGISTLTVMEIAA